MSASSNPHLMAPMLTKSNSSKLSASVRLTGKSSHFLFTFFRANLFSICICFEVTFRKLLEPMLEMAVTRDSNGREVSCDSEKNCMNLPICERGEHRFDMSHITLKKDLSHMSSKVHRNTGRNKRHLQILALFLH